MKAKMWAIKRREIYDVTYVIEGDEELSENEAKELLFRDGPDAAEEFDRTWVEDGPMEEWEILAVPEGMTFRLMFEHGDYKLTLLGEEQLSAVE